MSGMEKLIRSVDVFNAFGEGTEKKSAMIHGAGSMNAR